MTKYNFNKLNLSEHVSKGVVFKTQMLSFVKSKTLANLNTSN